METESIEIVSFNYLKIQLNLPEGEGKETEGNIDEMSKTIDEHSSVSELQFGVIPEQVQEVNENNEATPSHSRLNKSMNQGAINISSFSKDYKVPKMTLRPTRGNNEKLFTDTESNSSHQYSSN